MNKSVKRDPCNKKLWMIETTITLPDNSHHHLGKKGYRSSHEAEEDFPRQKEIFLKKHGFSAKAGFMTSLVDSYILFQSSRWKVSTTQNVKTEMGKWIGRFFEGKTVKQGYSRTVLLSWRKFVLGKSISSRTSNDQFRNFRSMSEYAFDFLNAIDQEDLRAARIATEPIASDAVAPKKKKAWTHEEANMFLETFSENDRWKLFFIWALVSGCRVGELRGLMWMDVNIEEGFVTIQHNAAAKSGTGRSEILTPKTKNGFRKIALSENMMKRFKRLKDSYPESTPDSFVFFGQSRPLGDTTIARILKEHISQCGCTRISIHEIRHTNTTWRMSMAKTPEEVKALSEELGRSPDVTMNVYWHVSDSYAKNQAEQLDDVISPKTDTGKKH